MLERQRVNLLESMGLKILRPRFQLPAAKPSRPLMMPDPVCNNSDSEPQAIATDSVMQAAPASVIDMPSVAPVNVANIASFFEEPDASAVVNKAVLEPNALNVRAIRYRHRLLRVGELLMLIDQPSLEWHEADRCKDFFGDLYFALAGKKFEYWSAAQFDWPPVKNFPLANDEIVAQQSLHAFLHEQIQQPPCQWIIAWGSGVSQSLLGKVLDSGQVEFLSQLPVLKVENYQEYWHSPLKKQILWQQLQAVKKSLVANA